MRTETWTFRSFALTAGLLLLVTTVSSSATADDNKAGVARISDAAPTTIHDSHVTPTGGRCADGRCGSGHCAAGTACSTGSADQGQVYEGPAIELTGNRFVDFWKIRKMKMGAWMTRKRHRAYGDCDNGDCRSGRKRKCGYFHPSGCCGGGCPPYGKYDMVYAANPTYFDSRDGRLYAAQGYNAPMAVPLAPNVRYSYNYGWGIPSSRLTRISRVAPEIPVIRVGP